jgi:Domain of unknown function (DUF6916)
MDAHNASSDRPRLITRRAALVGGGTAAFALSLPGRALARRRRLRLLSHLRRGSYHPLVGEHFTVRASGARLTLVSIEDLNRHQARSDNAFALVFRTNRGVRPLSTRDPVSLAHPKLGTFQFLLTPGNATFRGQNYLAIVNRLHA